MKTAEKVGEDLYSFKPTPDVRSLGGVLGHIADGNKLLCTVASGEPIDFEKMMKDLSAVQVREEDEESGDHRGAERDEGVLRVRVREDRRHERPGSRHGSGGQKMPKVMVLASQQPRVGTLRESGDLHAAEGDRSAFERAAADAVGSLW